MMAKSRRGSRWGMRTKQLFAIPIAFGIVLSASDSHAIYGDSNEAFGIDGSIRSNLFAGANHKLDFTGKDSTSLRFGLANALFRLVAEGQPRSWLKFELHGIASTLIRGSPNAQIGLFASANESLAMRYRLFDAQYDLIDDPNLQASASLERANLSFYFGPADLVIGRQALSFGKAFFWNPLDVFRPFDPSQFDRDYKSGVDAIRISVPLSEDSEISVVAASSEDSPETDQDRWYSSALILRLDSNLASWALAVQAGKIFGGYQLGAAASGELFKIPLRAEAAYFEPHPDDNVGRHAVFVLGSGYHFQNSLHIELEYFYNRAAVATPVALQRERLRSEGQFIPNINQHIASLNNDQVRRFYGFAHGLGEGRLLQVSSQLAGIMLSYNIFEILSASLSSIVSLSDQSAIIQPGLRLSIADEADLFVGGMISLGKRASGETTFCAQIGGCPESEFGTYPNLFYVQSKLYF